MALTTKEAQRDCRLLLSQLSDRRILNQFLHGSHLHARNGKESLMLGLLWWLDGNLAGSYGGWPSQTKRLEICRPYLEQASNFFARTKSSIARLLRGFAELAYYESYDKSDSESEHAARMRRIFQTYGEKVPEISMMAVYEYGEYLRKRKDPNWRRPFYDLYRGFHLFRWDIYGLAKAYGKDALELH